MFQRTALLKAASKIGNKSWGWGEYPRGGIAASLLRECGNLVFLRKHWATEKFKTLKRDRLQIANAHTGTSGLPCFQCCDGAGGGVCQHTVSQNASAASSPEFFSGLSSMSPLRSSNNPFNPGTVSLATATADVEWHLLGLVVSSSATPFHPERLLSFWASSCSSQLGVHMCVGTHSHTPITPTPVSRSQELRKTPSHPFACVRIRPATTGVLKGPLLAGENPQWRWEGWGARSKNSCWHAR